MLKACARGQVLCCFDGITFFTRFIIDRFFMGMERMRDGAREKTGERERKGREARSALTSNGLEKKGITVLNSVGEYCTHTHTHLVLCCCFWQGAEGAACPCVLARETPLEESGCHGCVLCENGAKTRK